MTCIEFLVGLLFKQMHIPSVLFTFTISVQSLTHSTSLPQPLQAANAPGGVDLTPWPSSLPSFCSPRCSWNLGGAHEGVSRVQTELSRQPGWVCFLQGQQIKAILGEPTKSSCQHKGSSRSALLEAVGREEMSWALNSAGIILNFLWNHSLSRST